MAQFHVTVSRTETRTHTLRVEAADEREAYDRGYAQANDFDYGNAAHGQPDYDVLVIEPIHEP